MGALSFLISLDAVLVAMREGLPHILVIEERAGLRLPSGAFEPQRHRTLERGIRSLVEEQTSHSLGYVEQLYSFGDEGRLRSRARGREERGAKSHVISIGYLALARMEARTPQPDIWRGWYDFFPWEDRRGGRAAALKTILPKLKHWAAEAPSKDRRARLDLCFGSDASGWDEEKVLERYELLYEAGLVSEAGAKDGQDGVAMQHDHRRIMATAIGRLRSKIKYRPVVFELMPNLFTFSELQSTVEAISGIALHTQNFRRLVEREALVERLTKETRKTGGRPATLLRFRPAVREAGLRLGRR